jgi:hypothetical protein
MHACITSAVCTCMISHACMYHICCMYDITCMRVSHLTYTLCVHVCTCMISHACMYHICCMYDITCMYVSHLTYTLCVCTCITFVCIVSDACMYVCVYVCMYVSYLVYDACVASACLYASHVCVHLCVSLLQQLHECQSFWRNYVIIAHGPLPMHVRAVVGFWSMVIVGSPLACSCHENRTDAPCCEWPKKMRWKIPTRDGLRVSCAECVYVCVASGSGRACAGRCC